MELLEIAGTQYSPYVKMDSQTREIVIAGVSRPENTAEFFSPILQWVTDYANCLRRDGDDLPATRIRIDLQYFNSITAKFVTNLILKCKSLYSGNEGLLVEWVYDVDDEEAYDWGMDLVGVVGMNFHFERRE